MPRHTDDRPSTLIKNIIPSFPHSHPTSLCLPPPFLDSSTCGAYLRWMKSVDGHFLSSHPNSIPVCDLFLVSFLRKRSTGWSKTISSHPLNFHFLLLHPLRLTVCSFFFYFVCVTYWRLKQDGSCSLRSAYVEILDCFTSLVAHEQRSSAQERTDNNKQFDLLSGGVAYIKMQIYNWRREITIKQKPSKLGQSVCLYSASVPLSHSLLWLILLLANCSHYCPE